MNRSVLASISFGLVRSVTIRSPSRSTYASGQISIGRLHAHIVGFFNSGVPFLRGARVDGHSIRPRCSSGSVLQCLHSSFYREAGFSFISR